MGTVRLTQLDGRLPNLALMKLTRFHHKRGDTVYFSRSPYRGMFEPKYDRVYGSAIFSFSADRVAMLEREFPGAVIGGTWNVLNSVTVEDVIGDSDERPDYWCYPGFDASIGFTARGCRLRCGFCVVPKKEGKPRAVNSIAEIWRGEPYPKHLYLLDNDFFGQPREQWEARVEEMRGGEFKVCLVQGVNVRMIGEVEAAALASLDYRRDDFSGKQLYTAWDNIGDEAKFFTGVDLLEKHGVKPSHLFVYMLIGYDRRETWETLLYRLERMRQRDVRPYPMIYGDRYRTVAMGGCTQRISHRTLDDFRRWVIRRQYMNGSPFEDFDYHQRHIRLAISSEFSVRHSPDTGTVHENPGPLFGADPIEVEIDRLRRNNAFAAARRLARRL
jgi:hypothetical protein